MYILVEVSHVTTASIKWNMLSQLYFLYTHTIFLFVFLNMSSFFKVGKVGCQSQCFRLKFSFCFSLQSISWGQVIFFKYSGTYATVVACSNTHVEIVLWTYTFILKSLEYANKDLVGRGPANKSHFLLASARNSYTEWPLQGEPEQDSPCELKCHLICPTPHSYHLKHLLTHTPYAL